ISTSPTGSSFAPGTVVTFTATPASGYQFSGWGGALSGTANPTTLTINANDTVSASFTKINYTLTVKTPTNGSISTSPTGSSFAPGTVVTFTATPASGYQFSGWGGALSGTANPTTLTINANDTVSASFT